MENIYAAAYIFSDIYNKIVTDTVCLYMEVILIKTFYLENISMKYDELN